jgi:hypothetical protein
MRRLISVLVLGASMFGLSACTGGGSAAGFTPVTPQDASSPILKDASSPILKDASSPIMR